MINKELLEEISKKKIFHLKNHDNGLFCGNVGICLFLFYVSRTCGNKELKEYAENFIEEILNSIRPDITPRFDMGLSGIGWAVEWLIQNKYCSGNSDEILEMIDSKIFKLLNEVEKIPINISNGLCGYLLYLSYRLRNKNSSNCNDIFLINKKMLIKVIAQIDKSISKKSNIIIRDVAFDLFSDIPVLLLVLNDIIKLDICNDMICKLVKRWMYYIGAYMPNTHCNRLYMAYSLQKINQHIKSNEISRYVGTLLFSIDYKKMHLEIDYKPDNIRYGWAGMLLLLEKSIELFNSTIPQYEQLAILKKDILKYNLIKFETSIQNIVKFNMKKEDERWGVFNGYTGVLLSLCFLK